MPIKSVIAGEYTAPDGSIIIVAEDGTITQKEEMACAPKEETLAVDPSAEVGANPGATASSEPAKIGEEKMEDTPLEDVIEEDKIEAPIEEEMAVGDAPTEAINYTKEEVDAKFDELYKLIADLKAEETTEDAVEEEMIPTQMSAMERFSEFVRFSKNI